MFGKSNINKSSEKLSTETKLISDISDTRHEEIIRYGRAEIFEEIDHYLEGDFRRAFMLVNHVPAILDDLIDANGDNARLAEAKQILSMSFNGNNIQTPESWSKHIGELGDILATMNREGISSAKQICDEVLGYWTIEEANLNRRTQILNAEDLDELNSDIGRSVGMQFLHLLTPDLDEDSKKGVARAYGFAIKLADNLSDVAEDLDKGFINISQEDIESFGINIKDWDQSNEQLYIDAMLIRIKQQYTVSDVILDRVIETNPNAVRGLELFKKVAHSWLKQVVEKYSDLVVEKF
ncbi:hypothetical protein KJ836_02470 [Patescibacteria group bacterium]|nr:hypothetical protein [Patescibacteria group bacterium]